MERENKKVSIVYILTGIILLLIIYLGLFVYKSFTNDEVEEENNTPSTTKMPEVASSCTFDMAMSEFNDIANNTEICGALNKINLTDVVVNGQTLNAVIYYSNSDDENTGIYVNDAEIASAASNSVVHKLAVLDNMLFMTTINASSANFEVFDENMGIIYSLADALNSLQIEDPTFTSLAATNPNLNTVLTYEYVDGNSFSFTNGQITFNSTSKTTCMTGSYSGSSYSITYEGSNFTNPTYIAGVACQ